MAEEKPPLILSSLDVERIETLLESMRTSDFANRAALEREIDRAEILSPESIPPTVVTMNSTVRFVIEESGEEFALTLVYPKDLQGMEDRVSVFAPIGSALLGLSVGDSLSWPAPGGKQMTVLVKEVLFQPERSGELHR
ncbi:nucleoside diphosphate kinase regulator [Lampropedia aestuarii]|uniref:Nucleoside diphosphate kinase regulator n=1 Tax=Lampropedia aestuarii TaxID=2562762 RepID=A0A4S5BTG4_9BURK|nr:nucleoside diphosphate kinase regulator [Lampropedia aestuarii]MDH5856319.1 nucleoside diphosphate kinase regulator [Lampropedia aestuarii]THJ34275.1 nucleoside diphosphate kinase regulator [Lampropedia aestuarii]